MTEECVHQLRVATIAQMAAMIAAGDAQALYREKLRLDIEYTAQTATSLYEAVERLNPRPLAEKSDA